MEEKLQKTNESNSADFLDAYELIAENTQTVNQAEQTKCRFCGKSEPEVTFIQETHLIPELLGRNDTQTTDECDECNHLFSGFESHLAILFRPHLAMLQVQGKRKIPDFHSRNRSYDGVNPGLMLKRDAKGQRYLEVRDDTAVRFDDEDKTGQITFQKQPYIPIKAYKALLKIGLSMLPADQLAHYQPVFDWLQGGEVRFGYIARAWKTTLLRKQYERPNAKVYQARNIVKDGEEFPEHVLILGFANVILQLFLPFSQAFDQLHDCTNRLSLSFFPGFLYDDLTERKSVNIEVIDLSSEEAVEEDEEMHLTFGERIRTITRDNMSNHGISNPSIASTIQMRQFTGIEDFEITNQTCFVCGRPATTREHIFPKWLQHKFNLWDERITIPNGTDIPYRQLTVPCCAKCNNEVYGQLEDRISSGSETEADIWRWANKVHFALTLKDKFLEWDRKKPGYKIGDVISPADELEQSRHFLHCVSGDFKCDPDPFGSVFRFDFKEPQSFNFIHLLDSGSICISMGDRGYVVFVRDGQFLRDEKGVMDDYRELCSRDLIEVDMLFFYAKNLEYMKRFTITNPVMIMKGQIVKLGRSTIREEKPADKELLAALCKRFGFTWIEKN